MHGRPVCADPGNAGPRHCRLPLETLARYRPTPASVREGLPDPPQTAFARNSPQPGAAGTRARRGGRGVKSGRGIPQHRVTSIENAGAELNASNTSDAPMPRSIAEYQTIKTIRVQGEFRAGGV